VTQDPRVTARRLGWAAAAILVLALTVFVGRGGSRPKDPYLADGSTATSGSSGSAPPSAAAGPHIPGFGEERLRVVGGRSACVAVADTDAQRARGLMERTDLAGADGMVFVFPADTTERFYMRNTPLPLTIAWFDAANVLVAQADMAPCPDRDGCPTFSAGQPYRTALEVPRGGLARLGLARGSAISLGGPC